MSVIVEESRGRMNMSEFEEIKLTTSFEDDDDMDDEDSDDEDSDDDDDFGGDDEGDDDFD